MIANKFQDLIVWQKSKELLIIVFPASKKIRDYSFRDQLNRATLSISNNIAEGFGRRTNKEFKRFLNIALGSAFEVNSMLILFKELSIISNEESSKALELSEEVIRLLIGLSRKIIEWRTVVLRTVEL